MPMKIIFLHHANYCKGGIERMMAMKANYLSEQMGWEVILLTYEQNGEPFPYELSPKVRQVDLDVHLYSAYKTTYPLRYYKKIRLRRKLSQSLCAFLKEEKADVIISTDKDAHELKALYKAHTTEKLVVEAHTGMVDHEMQVQRTNFFWRRQIAYKDLLRLKLAVSNFDVLIALTEEDARCWQPWIKTVVMPNTLTYFPSQAANLSEEKKHVIAVGRLDYQKGQDLLLQAWQKVEQQHPDWFLDIYGDGLEKKALISQISSLRLQRVAIHPATTNIYAEYMKCDFLVCSSRWESFGLVIIEAMSCGLPVVSFDCDNGPRSIIANGEDGILVQNGDVCDMSSKICRMIEDQESRVRMGAAARQNVYRYNETSVYAQYVAFLKGLVS